MRSDARRRIGRQHHTEPGKAGPASRRGTAAYGSGGAAMEIVPVRTDNRPLFALETQSGHPGRLAIIIRCFDETSRMQHEVRLSIRLAYGLPSHWTQRFGGGQASLIVEKRIQLVIDQWAHRNEFWRAHHPKPRANDDPALTKTGERHVK